MKYVLFFDTPQARGGSLLSLDLRKKERSKREESIKDEKKYGKIVFPAHQYATGKGLVIVEFDDPKQIANRMALNAPDGDETGVRYKIMPLIEGAMYQDSLENIRK